MNGFPVLCSACGTETDDGSCACPPPAELPATTTKSGPTHRAPGPARKVLTLPVVAVSLGLVVAVLAFALTG